MCTRVRTSARANAGRSPTCSWRTRAIDRNSVCLGDGPRRGRHHGSAGKLHHPNRQTAVSTPWHEPVQSWVRGTWLARESRGQWGHRCPTFGGTYPDALTIDTLRSAMHPRELGDRIHQRAVVVREVDAATVAAQAFEAHSRADAPIRGPGCPACELPAPVRTSKRFGVENFFCGDCQHRWERRVRATPHAYPRVSVRCRYCL